MSELSISLIQTHLYWEDIPKNLAHFDQKIEEVGETDLIVLPETFSTAFTMNSTHLAEDMDGSAVQWLQTKAKEKAVAICGTCIIKVGTQIFNRLIYVDHKGDIQYYDKRHLFRMGDEDRHFTAGEEKLIINLKGWKICPQICYDLRFPVWSRNKFHRVNDNSIQADYDLLIYMANWPEVRVGAWQKLLYARAIENQAYVAAANRIGEDGIGVNCSGSSMIVDFKGDLLWEAEDQKEAIQTLKLDKEALDRFRQKFPVGLDADKFEILT